MKFLVDMGISLRTVSCLRGDGYDVVHLRDEGLQRLPDNEILIKARIEGRILLTDVLCYLQLSQRLLVTDNRASMPTHLEAHWSEGGYIWG